MRKRILSLCLSAVILMGAGAVCGTAARATETAGEGATNTETAQILEEITDNQVPTDAAGNVITPETAKAIDNADLGAAMITGENSEEAENQSAASEAEEVLQAPTADETEMNKSTIGAAFDSSYQFKSEDTIAYITEAAAVKSEPFDDAEDIVSLEKYSSINLTGTNDLTYWEVRVGGTKRTKPRASRSRKRFSLRRLPRPRKTGRRRSKKSADPNSRIRQGAGTGAVRYSPAARAAYTAPQARRLITTSI